jgi:hypothetical protein
LIVVPAFIARSIALALASNNEHGDGNPIQNNKPDESGGGARGPSDATGGSSAPSRKRSANGSESTH